MAGSGVERRDGKLESFLLKHLPLEEYERLLTRQPCVAVVGKSEKPAHRHAVVGHCRLYLIDVPPRNLKMTLQLRDMESVHLVGLAIVTCCPICSLAPPPIASSV